jgi:hypothetical protein
MGFYRSLLFVLSAPRKEAITALISNKIALILQILWALFCLRVTSDFSLHHELCKDDVVYFVGYKERLKNSKETGEYR